MTPWSKFCSYRGFTKVTCVLWNPKVHCHVYKSSSLHIILNQMNPVHNHTLIFKVYFIIIIWSLPVFPNGLFPSGFFCISSLLHFITCLKLLTFIWLINIEAIATFQLFLRKKSWDSIYVADSTIFISLCCTFLNNFENNFPFMYQSTRKSTVFG